MKQRYYVAILVLLSVQLQMNPSLATDVQDQDASLASCAVRTSDIKTPTTGLEIQDIVTRYVTDPTCNTRLPTAIDSIFRDEQRNAEWAAPLERIINQAALAHRAKIAGVCHTSLCRYDIELTPSVDSARSPHEVEHQVIDAVSGTPLQVDSLQSYGSNFRFTIYFYSTFVPAAFLEPLRARMEAAK